MAGKKEITEILKLQANEVKPSAEELKALAEMIAKFLFQLNSALKRKKISASAVLGGSFEKGTLIKKEHYDIDVFVRFASREKSDKLADILETMLKTMKLKYERLHGSRDYFNVNLVAEDKIRITAEIVPVLAIKKAREALNVTDVSMLHVDYVKQQIRKKPALADEIRLVKAFVHAQECYGAESHIRGFSGYLLELLTCYYGSFLKLLQAASRWNLGQKIIVDPAKHYKGKEALTELNEAKLISPLVMIDPVQADRNAAAALSDEKFLVFVKASQEFLKKPSESFFTKKEFSLEELKKEAKGKKSQLIVISAETSKTKEDVAGAKLLKFFRFLSEKLEKEGYAIRAEWKFSFPKATFFFIAKKKEKLIKEGPPLKMKKNVEMFKKQHKKCVVKKGRIFAVEKVRDFKEIISEIKKARFLEDMGIKKIEFSD